MPGYTPLLHLPYPLQSEPPDAPVQVKALADALDGQTPGSQSLFIVGEVRFIAVTARPVGWLACDGSAVSRATYAALFAAIQTTFGLGDGSTTFGLPDLRGRTPIGSGTGPGLTARAIGDKPGEELHTLTSGEAAQKAVSTNPETTDHTHGSPNSQPFQTTLLNYGLAIDGGAQPGWFPNGYTGATTGRSSNHTHVVAGSNAAAGHNTMQPSLAIPAYIYAGA